MLTTSHELLSRQDWAALHRAAKGMRTGLVPQALLIGLGLGFFLAIPASAFGPSAFAALGLSSTGSLEVGCFFLGYLLGWFLAWAVLRYRHRDSVCFSTAAGSPSPTTITALRWRPRRIIEVLLHGPATDTDHHQPYPIAYLFTSTGHEWLFVWAGDLGDGETPHSHETVEVRRFPLTGLVTSCTGHGPHRQIDGCFLFPAGHSLRAESFTLLDGTLEDVTQQLVGERKNAPDSLFDPSLAASRPEQP